MSNAAVKDYSIVKRPTFMLASTHRAGEPWLPADGNSLRLNDDEILSDIKVVLSVSKRPDDIGPSGWPDELSLVVGMLVDREKIERGPEAPLRQITTSAPLPSKNALARILLYCWYTCLAQEFDESSSVEDLLKELRRVAKDLGFISASDVVKKPGRPPRVFKLKNTRRLKRFAELRAKFPDVSPDQISKKVADLEKARSASKNRNIQIEVRRFFHRQGLVPKSTKSTTAPTEKN